MRVPTQQRRPFRMRGWMIAVVVILLVLLFSLRGLAGVYTDKLWFNSLGQGDTWWGLLAAKVVPALVFTVLFFAILLANLLIADRLAPRVRGIGTPTPEDELVVRYQQSTAQYQGRIRVLVAAFFALVAGIGVSAQWREWILFTNRSDFHSKDPQFHRDVGFYVFQLPFIKFMIDWLFAGLVIVLLVTAVAHYLNGGIRFQSPLQRVTPQVKAHNPTAMTGSTQPRRQMFHRNSNAAMIDTMSRNSSAGSWACTSVYPAPSTTPRCEKLSSKREK
jgi:uncharacterized membrane protein (UPF0182 family)